MDKYLLFESYISGTLTKDKSASFQSNLENDAQLKSEFYEHVKTRSALDILLEDDVKNVIADLKKDLEISKKGNNFKWKTYVAAACLAGLLVVGYLLFQPKESATPTDTTEQIIAEYYKKPLDDGTRGDKIFNAHTAKIQEETNRAHRLFQQKKYQEAATAFQNVLMQTDGKERERTEWYLILSLLKDNKESAKTLLTNLTANQNHVRHNEAVRLAATLNEK